MFGLKEEHINLINTCFAQYAAIEQVILYGSRAKGTFRNGSDIDLTIIDNTLTYSELMRLENVIDDLMLPYKMDISLKREISNPDLLALGKFFMKKKLLINTQWKKTQANNGKHSPQNWARCLIWK